MTGRVGRPPQERSLNREIAALAVPALGALAAEPLVSLADTAFVGRLGASAQGGLGIGVAVFSVAFVVFNFLAYGTTPYVARAAAAGLRSEAGRYSFAAIVLGVGIGVPAAVGLALGLDPAIRLMGATPDVVTPATTYLGIRLWSLPAVLIVTVGHGVFRGYQDTTTPFLVTAGLSLVNVVLDPIFMFGLGGGIAGAAWASVVAQWSGALVFLWLLIGSRGRSLGIEPFWPTWSDVRPLIGAGRALILRTGALIATFTVATSVAARTGTVAVAAHQVAFQVWLFLALIVDALAVAGQAMIGARMASPDRGLARIAANRLLAFGLGAGVALGALVAALAPVLPGLFTNDAEVVAAVRQVYLFVVILQPLNAIVFVWDGVIIGAGDYPFLAAAMIASAAVAIAVLLAVVPNQWGLTGVWWALTALMVVRLGTLGWWHRRHLVG